MFWLQLALFSLALAYSAEELDPVDVTATKELSDFHLGSVETVSTGKTSSALMNEAIGATLGVATSQNGGPGSRTSYFIRGTEARHVSFTIDGLKINDPSNTDRQFDAAFLTSPFIREVTLYKGPQAVLFGSDAMGGLVDMRTRKGEAAPVTRFQLSGGSFGTFDTTLSQDWQVKESKGTLTWTSFRTDGISRLNKKRHRATERDGADLTQLTSSSAHSWNEKWHTDFLASFVRGNNELDGFADDNSHDKSRSDQYLIQQRTGHDLSGSSMVSLRNGISRHQRKINTLSVGENSYEGDLIQNELLFNKERKSFKFLGGFSNEKELFDQNDLDRGAELNSVFSQISLKDGPFTFQGGLRGDHHSRYRSYYTGSSGISLKLSDYTMAIQYSQGFKSPSLYQLYAEPIFGLPIGNKDLRPEKNNAIEGRWAFEKKEFKLDLVWFRNTLSNLIIFTNEGYKNQPRFLTEGVELSAGVNSRSFRLRPYVALQEFKEEKGPVLRRPTRSIGADVGWLPKEGLEFYVQFRQNNKREDLDENGNTIKLNGYETITLGTLLKHKLHEFGVRILNITDKNYEDLYGYSVMPRSLFVHFGTSI